MKERGRIMLVGASGSGKTTLLARLCNPGAAFARVRKTQVMEFSDFAVDTPGEYVQIPRLFFAVLYQVGDARTIWVLQDATSTSPSVPAGFARAFASKAVGVITKVDLPDADIARACRFLAEAGVPQPYYAVSAVSGEGLDELRQLLRDC